MAATTDQRAARASEFVLIINDAESAADVLRAIARFSSAFKQNPIVILRADNQADAGAIATFTKKYRITRAPALVSRRGLLAVGCAKTCEAIASIARNCKRPVSASAHEDEAREAQACEQTFIDYAMGVAMQPGEDCDDKKDDEDGALSREAMEKRMSAYQSAMKARGVHILCSDEDRAQARPPPRAQAQARPPPRAPAERSRESVVNMSSCMQQARAQSRDPFEVALIDKLADEMGGAN